MFKRDNPYEQSEFYDMLLNEIYKYFSKAELIDDYYLYKMHNQIYVDYISGNLDYDWRKVIKDYKDKKEGSYSEETY